MRKCKYIENVKYTRSDEELLKLYEEYRSSYATSTSYDAFVRSNKSYFQKEDRYGFFHQFGNDYEEFENGAGNYTDAIIESYDGRLVRVKVESVEFLPNDFENISFCNHNSYFGF